LQAEAEADIKVEINQTVTEMLAEHQVDQVQVQADRLAVRVKAVAVRTQAVAVASLVTVPMAGLESAALRM
jgi:hypothetical protein